MAGGAGFLDPHRRKIKGKRLTVLRFFNVSVAYTIGWYTICSELDYFRKLFGPQILLQLNIAYYLPSIPLLLISGQFDQRLEQRFGVVAVVLTRLMVGLLGCAVITAVFPLAFWLHNESHAHWFILGSSVLLGLCTGTAFSASYQLVSRFANKNVIALGLGFVCSGLVTLVIQVVLELLPLSPWTRQLLMYQTVTAITLTGLTGALTILYRKRHELEDIVATEHALTAGHPDDGGQHHDHDEYCYEAMMSAPQHHDGHHVHCNDNNSTAAPLPSSTISSLTNPLLHTPTHPTHPHAPSTPPTRASALEGSSSMRRASSMSRLPSLAAFDFIDPAQTLPLWEPEDTEVTFQPGSIPEGTGSLLSLSREGSRGGWGGRGSVRGGSGSGARGGRGYHYHYHHGLVSSTLEDEGEGEDDDHMLAGPTPTMVGLPTPLFGIPTTTDKHPQHTHSLVHAAAGPGSPPPVPISTQSTYTHTPPHPSLHPPPPPPPLSSTSNMGAPTSTATHTQSSPSPVYPHPPPPPTTTKTTVMTTTMTSMPPDTTHTPGLHTTHTPSVHTTHSPSVHPLVEILALIWPILIAFSMSGVTILVVFPFFTYIESSGVIGERLPKVLFFMRFLGDIIGRLMPRNRALIVTSPLAIMALGCLMISTVPLYFAYIKAPAMYRSDTGIIAYIVLLWLLCGYVNTTCNITAPKLVKPTLKTGAAGLMAIVFQVSHFCGLCVAVGVSYAFFGGLGGGGH